jgi:hypothetical protein
MITVEQLARICHEANRAYCEALGDHSQLPWGVAPQWQRDSAVLGVQTKLKHPKATPEAMHKAWFSHKQAEGWKYAPVKNAEKKEHPCMVPYEDLPVAERQKDSLFSAVVESFFGKVQQ